MLGVRQLVARLISRGTGDRQEDRPVEILNRGRAGDGQDKREALRLRAAVGASQVWLIEKDRSLADPVEPVRRVRHLDEETGVLDSGVV